MSPPPGLARRTPTHAISSSQLFQCPFAFREPRFFTAAPLSKAGAKIQPFSKTPKFFFAFSRTFFAHTIEPARCGRNFFSKIAENVPKHYAKNGKNTRFFKKSALLDTGKTEYRYNLLIHTCLMHSKRIHILRSILTHCMLHQTPNRPSADLSIGTTALGGRQARHTRAVQSRLDAACFPACFPSSCRVTMP